MLSSAAVDIEFAISDLDRILTCETFVTAIAEEATTVLCLS